MKYPSISGCFSQYAIDFSSDLFPNYLRLKFVCLNEDFSKAIELMNEVITNSTFEEFEKEKIKIKNKILLKDKEDILSLFKMTPYYYHTSDKDKEKLASVENLEVTTDFAVYIFQV